MVFIYDIHCRLFVRRPVMLANDAGLTPERWRHQSIDVFTARRYTSVLFAVVVWLSNMQFSSFVIDVQNSKTV